MATQAATGSVPEPRESGPDSPAHPAVRTNAQLLGLSGIFRTYEAATMAWRVALVQANAYAHALNDMQLLDTKSLHRYAPALRGLRRGGECAAGGALAW